MPTASSNIPNLDDSPSVRARPGRRQGTIFSDALRRARTDKGQTITKAAHGIGIDPGLLSRYERGERGAEDKNVQKIVHYYGKPLAELV